MSVMCPNPICGQIFVSEHTVTHHVANSTCWEWIQQFINDVSGDGKMGGAAWADDEVGIDDEDNGA